MSSPQLYHYNENGLYMGTDPNPPQLSPLDLEDGKEVYLIPANATIVSLPEYDPQQQDLYFDNTSQAWRIEDKPPLNYIEINIQNRIYLNTLLPQIKQAYTDVAVTIVPAENTESLMEKTVRCENVLAIPDNISAITGIINSHDYVSGKMSWIRVERSSRIGGTEWIRTRHQDELKLIELQVITQTTLSEQQFAAWIIYWQALRDFPINCDPLNLEWPIEPALQGE